VSVNTVAGSVRRQGLQGRKPKHRKGLTEQDATAAKFPDLLHRDFNAPAPNIKWCGDITEIPTDEGKFYPATVLDLFSRKLLACPTSTHPGAELPCDAIKIATTMRGGRTKVEGVVFHTDRGSTYTATRFTGLFERLGVRQSMGGSDRASTMLPRRRSSPRWNTRCCPGGTTSPPEIRAARS
jgi:transposase InsO family protein